MDACAAPHSLCLHPCSARPTDVISRGAGSGSRAVPRRDRPGRQGQRPDAHLQLRRTSLDTPENVSQILTPPVMPWPSRVLLCALVGSLSDTSATRFALVRTNRPGVCSAVHPGTYVRRAAACATLCGHEEAFTSRQCMATRAHLLRTLCAVTQPVATSGRPLRSDSLVVAAEADGRGGERRGRRQPQLPRKRLRVLLDRVSLRTARPAVLWAG